MHDNRTRRTDRAAAAPEGPLRVADVIADDALQRVSGGIPASATGIVTVDLAQIRANWRALSRHVAPA